MYINVPKNNKKEGIFSTRKELLKIRIQQIVKDRPHLSLISSSMQIYSGHYMPELETDAKKANFSRKCLNKINQK